MLAGDEGDVEGEGEGQDWREWGGYGRGWHAFNNLIIQQTFILETLFRVQWQTR